MMKLIKVFSVFFLLHVIAWGGTHFYLEKHKKEVLLVVDTSFAMKSKFPLVKKWISDFNDSQRYTNIVIGTDKALLGNLEELNSIDSIFRTSFGRIHEDSLKRFSNYHGVHYFLSDGSVNIDGWKNIVFD